MRRMNTRQAILTITLFLLLFGASACSSLEEAVPTATVTLPPTSTATVTPSPSPVPPTATATPLGCLSQPGKIEQGVVTATVPSQEFLIYLPPCYSELTDLRYPVLYLLHGQTYTMDQWVRLGVPQVADEMYLRGESVPFIVVFPNDNYWNSSPGSTFGVRLVGALVPHIDANYRTIPDRDHRALGGLSRGGGWTAQLGLENPGMFGSLGLHSPAIFKGDGYFVDKLMQSIPQESRPRIWLDAGDNDRELKSIVQFEQSLTRYSYTHEYHFLSGDHSELYWGLHVHEYLQWYAEAWNPQPESE